MGNVLDGVYLGRKAPLQTVHGARQVAAFFLFSMFSFCHSSFLLSSIHLLLFNPVGLSPYLGLGSADETSVKLNAASSAVFPKDVWPGSQHEEFGLRATSVGSQAWNTVQKDRAAIRRNGCWRIRRRRLGGRYYEEELMMFLDLANVTTIGTSRFNLAGARVIECVILRYTCGVDGG